MKWLRNLQNSYQSALFFLDKNLPNQRTSLNIDVIDTSCRPVQTNPIISPQDIFDFGNVDFVADPFILEVDNKIHLFFEIYNKDKEPTAVIGHAESNDRGESWNYTGVVLKTDRHASYPYVFRHDGSIYMIPGLASKPGAPAPAKLYKSVDFPREWKYIDTILEPDHPCLDTTVFEYKGRFWALVGSGKNDELHLYYNKSLLNGNWKAHSENPVVKDRLRAGRPGGRPIFGSDSIFLPLQDCREEYGHELRLYEISHLTPTSYSDKPVSEEATLGGTGKFGWNSGRMHHLDLHYDDTKVVAVFDGDFGFGRNFFSGAMWSIGFCSSELEHHQV